MTILKTQKDKEPETISIDEIINFDAFYEGRPYHQELEYIVKLLIKNNPSKDIVNYFVNKNNSYNRCNDNFPEYSIIE